MDPRKVIRHPLGSPGSVPGRSRLVVATVAAVVIVVLGAVYLSWKPTSASARHTLSKWELHDSAVYVVSTMNLARCNDRRLLTPILDHQFGVTHYDVYADQLTTGLFFIEPKRSDGSSAGALAYQMGWMAPQSVSSWLDALHMHRAPPEVSSAFKNDQKRLIGSFASTVPS
jgi:hypothetical protein